MLGFPAGFIYCLSGIFISGHSTSHIFRHFICNLYQNSIHIRHLQQSQEQTFNDLSNSTTRIHSAVKPFISPQVQNNPEQRLLMYSSKILKFITDNTLSQHFVHDNITLKILSDSTLGNTTNCKVKGGQSATQINLIINYPRLSQVSVSEKKVKYTTQIQKCNFFFFSFKPISYLYPVIFTVCHNPIASIITGNSRRLKQLTWSRPLESKNSV